MPERAPESAERRAAYWFTITKSLAEPAWNERTDEFGSAERRQAWVGARMAVDDQESHLIPKYVDGTRTIALDMVWVEFGEAMRALREMDQDETADYYEGMYGKPQAQLSAYLRFRAKDGALWNVQENRPVTELPLPMYSSGDRLGS